MLVCMSGTGISVSKRGLTKYTRTKQLTPSALADGADLTEQDFFLYFFACFTVFAALFARIVAFRCGKFWYIANIFDPKRRHFVLFMITKTCIRSAVALRIQVLIFSVSTMSHRVFCTWLTSVGNMVHHGCVPVQTLGADLPRAYRTARALRQ